MRRLALAPLVLLLASACATNSAFYKGLDALDAGDEASAEEQFRASLDDPENGARAASELEDILVNRARAKENSDPAGARTIYEEALALDPDSHRARMGVGRTLELEHRFEEALAVLTADPKCGTCKKQTAEVYEQRGRGHMVDERFEEAAADFQAALASSPDAAVYIDISELFTAGHYGTAMEAAQALNAGHPLIERGMVQLQELWSVERREVAIAAVAKHEYEAVDLALTLPDPRIALDLTQRRRAMFEVMLDVARAQQEHGDYHEGLQRGLGALSTATAELDAEDPVLVTLHRACMDLYSRAAAHFLSVGESREAGALLVEALAKDPENLTLRYQAILAMSAVSQDKAETMIAKIPESSPHWKRVHALVRISRAQAHLAEEDLGGAQTELAAAGREFPDLLEVRLVKAEILARTRLEGLSRADAAEFRRIGTYTVPRGRVHRYAEALGEIEWARARWEEESVRLDPLRMPGFGALLGALEAEIRAFYPFKVRKLPGREPRVAIHNTKDAAVTVSVIGPELSEKLEIGPGKTKTSVFGESGFVHIRAGKREFGLFAENKTLVTVEL